MENKFFWDESDRPKKGKRAAPYSLKKHVEHLGEPTLKYELLCKKPDYVQDWLEAKYDLNFVRKFSEWPFSDFQFPSYWYGALGAPEAIRPARELEGDIPEEIQEAARELGYD